MTDLEIAFELAHPPARVWRALTEAPLLSDWLGPCDGPSTFDAGERIRLRLDGLIDGPIDGELVEVLAPYRLVMRWEGEQLHARTVWELVETADGTRLSMSVSGFLGLPTGVRRQQWRAGLTSRVEVGLPLVLAELAVASAAVRDALPARESLFAAIAAIEQIDVGTPKPPAADIPRQHTGGVAPVVPLPARKPRRTWLVAGVAVGAAVILVATATALVLSATRPEQVAGRVAPDELRHPPTLTPAAEPPAQQAVGTPAPSRGPATPAARPSRTAVTGGPGGPAAPVPVQPAQPSRPSLRASYTVERTGLLGTTGYKVTARIDNPGSVPVGDWRLTFTLPGGQKASTVSGAQYRQDGATATFTPGEAVPPRGSITVSFEVSGLLAGEPSGCTIDGRSCG